jgi:4-hydroxy-2-oxoglutarate aldolase
MEARKGMSTSTISLRGVFPPITTPFDGEGRVHLAALSDNLERWNKYDLAGYVVLGSNGEAVYLTEEEKIRVWETARDAVPSGKLLIAGTGCESTQKTIALTRKAATAGADAALLVTPHYYSGRMTSPSLLHHYESVAAASPIPVMIYNVPKFTHVDMDAATIAQASRHPNIAGVKDSSGNIAKLSEVVRLAEPGFQVLAGTGGFFFAGLSLGAVGGILALANVAPRQSINIQRLHDAGRWEEAAELQRQMIPVNAAVTAVYGIAGLKAALDMLGYYGGTVRSPLLELDDTDKRALRQTMLEAGLL